jgi:hypothetical protein
MSKIIVPANVVREWAKGADLSTVEGLPKDYTLGERGRLHPAIRAAFEKANKGVRYEVGHKEQTVHTVKTFKINKKGGKTPIQKKVSATAVREAALAAGVKVGERGVPQKAVMEAFVRGDLASLVSAN